MSSLNSNLFAIGRRHDDEVQLTALLGALFRREQSALDRFLTAIGIEGSAEAWSVEVELVHSWGRFDLVISSTEAIIVVESKIRAAFGQSQVRRYLERLSDDAPGRDRFLIILSPDRVALDQEDRTYASAQQIQLSSLRWQDLAGCLGDPGDDTLAGDFVELLVSEGLAQAPGLDEEDWRALHGAPRAFSRLVRLIEAASARIIASGVMVEATRPRATGERRVSTTLSHGNRKLRIGVASSDGHRRPDTPPVVWVGLSDTSVPKGERRRWAEGRAGALGGEPDQVWVVRKQPAAGLLQGSFDEQVDALVRFAHDLLAADEAHRSTAR